MLLHDGRELQGAVDEPRGDPGNTLSRDEIECKVLKLAAFRQAASPDETRRLIDWVWNLELEERIVRLLPQDP